MESTLLFIGINLEFRPSCEDARTKEKRCYEAFSQSHGRENNAMDHNIRGGCGERVASVPVIPALLHRSFTSI